MGTKQTNFAICDCLITRLEARPVADSKTSLIMSHSERFKSLLKGFTALKMHLIFCLLLDTMNYTHSALHIFSNSKVLDCLGGYLGRGKYPAAPRAFHSSSLSQTTCLLMTVFSIGSGSNFFHLLARLLLLSYLHVHSSLTAQGIWMGTGGSRRQWLGLGHHTDQRWDQTAPSWSRSSI